MNGTLEEALAKEIANLVRAHVEKHVAELRAESCGLQARIARLEVALAEKTARQMSRPLQIGRDLQ